MTPEGVKRESEVDRSQSIAKQTGQKLNYAIIGLLVVALGYFIWESRFAYERRSEPVSQETPVQPGETGDEKTTPDLDAAEPTQTISRQSIAVLPFDNRSPDANDAYFAEGIHDDLLTNLSRIGSLKVISRTSVTQYKGTEKTIPQIAAELGVATIMEGAVQRSGNQVRINVQLIDAQTDEHLWAEIFDRELTAQNLFAIQSEISEAIASALKATLTSDEQQLVNTVPTQNLLAYEAYLRGRQLMATRNASSLEQALAEFENAVKLDPQFALAWVGVADSNLLLPNYGTASDVESIAKARLAVDRALAINDRLGEAYASLAGMLSRQDEWDLSEAAFKKSIELSPNYATAWHWYSDTLGNFPLRIDESIEMALKASELDPNSAIISSNLGHKYRMKGLYSMAERQLRRVIELNPEFAAAYANLGNLYAYNLGQFAKAIPYFEKANELAPDDIWQKTSLLDIYLEIGDFQAADAVRSEITELSPDHLASAWADVVVNFYQSNHAAIREAINYALPKAKDNPGIVISLAYIDSTEGDPQQTLDIFLAKFPGWMIPEQWTGLINQYTSDACMVSWLLMRTGDEPLGRRLLNQATQFLEQDLPAVMEHTDTYWPEMCLAARGDFENALASMETRINHNHLMLWQASIRLPMFDPLRDDPRFIALQQEYERKIAVQRAEIDAMRAEAGL
jgi:TolB-like protein/Tfp pilus assembly protein PilF